jgi:hypothetical protein
MQLDGEHSQLSSIQPQRAVIDYASPATVRRWKLRAFISALLIALLAVAYALACRRAYWQSSWPPLDRLSQGWSWVWVPGAAIFLLVVPRSRWTLAWLPALAALTAGIHAWTYPFETMNPIFSWDWGMWFSNLTIALPIHLITTGIVAGLCWGLLLMLDVPPLLGGADRTLRSRLAPLVLMIACISAAPMIAYGYASFKEHSDAAAGTALADRDWASHEPVIWTHDIPLYRSCGDFSLACDLDPELNIPLRQSWYRRFEAGYNAEIRRLLAANKPAWLAKFPRIDDQDMLRMKQSDGMKTVTTYPYTLSANAIIIRGSATLPWGDSISTGSNTALVETKHDSHELFNSLDASQPILVGQLAKYPGIHFIRDATTVIACSDDGWILETLMAP